MAPVSPWFGALEGRAFAPPELQADPPPELRCELVVIGGGIAGLHAALRGAELGLDVVLLEAEYCGYGASGRNAGHLTPTIGKDLPSLGWLYGEEKASRLVSIAESAVDFTQRALRRLRIDADYEAVGNVLAAVHERQHSAVQRVLDWALRLGARVENVAPDQVHAQGLPRCVYSAARETIGGVLNPAKYVIGLRRACVAAGVRLYEKLPARAPSSSGPGRVELTHAKGRVLADYAVVANNAFAPSLGLMGNRMVPLYVQLFQSAPLEPQALDTLNWGSRCGIYTAHELLESYRLTPDLRIVGGAKMVRYAYGGRVLTEPDVRWARELERVFRQRFPTLAGLELEAHWGGPIAMTLDFLPAVGSLRGDPRIGYALAFAGHGVALAGLAGHSVVDELLGRHTGDRTLLDHHTRWIPPEPARWLTAQALLGLFGSLDARLDRKIERAQER